MTAAANAKQRAAKAKKIRQFVTPEGVDLELRIASAGLRFGALLVDMILINLVLLLFWLFTEWIGFASRRSEEHTSELQSLMRISYAVFCLKKKKKTTQTRINETTTRKISYESIIRAQYLDRIATSIRLTHCAH